MARPIIRAERAVPIANPSDWLLLSHPNPNYPQTRTPRREQFSGVITVHATAGALDRIAPDTGAENVGAFIRRRTDAGGYNRLADTDSRLRLCPVTTHECWHTGIHRANHHAGSVAGAFHPNDLDMGDPMTHQVLRNMAADVVDEWREWAEPQQDWVRWLSVAEANSRRMPGLIHHGDMDPGTRTDAWARHPQRGDLDAIFLEYVLLEMGWKPDEEEEEMPLELCFAYGGHVVYAPLTNQATVLDRIEEVNLFRYVAATNPKRVINRLSEGDLTMGLRGATKFLTDGTPFGQR